MLRFQASQVFHLPNENIATVDNKGYEIVAGIHKNITPDLRIDLTGNFSHNKNNVVFQDEPIRAVEWQQTTGHPYGACADVQCYRDLCR